MKNVVSFPLYLFTFLYICGVLVTNRPTISQLNYRFMTLRCIIIIVISILLVRCSSDESVGRIYLSKEYQAIDSLSCSVSMDSIRILAEELRAESELYNTADAYADAYLAWGYNVQEESDSVIKYAEKSRLKFLVIGNKLTSAELYDLANVELLLGYYNMMISPKTSQFYLAQALEKYQKLNRTSRIVDVYIYMAELHKNGGNLNESLKYLRLVEVLCDTLPLSSSNDYSWMLGILTDLSYMSHELGDNRQMDRYLDFASTYYDKSDTDAQMYYLVNRTKAYIYQKKYSLAAYSAERLERLSSACGEYNSLSSAYIFQGLAMSRMGLYSKAKEYQQKAESVATLYGLTLMKEKLMLDGELAAEEGNFKLAHNMLYDSIESDHRYFEYSALLESRICMYSKQGDYASMYALQKQQQSYIDSMQINYIYEHENARVEASKSAQMLLKDEVGRLKMELERSDRVSLLERIIYILLLFVAVSLIVYQIRNSDRRNKAVIDREYKRLKEDNDSKIELVKKQKDMLLVTNKRISESITYAERIQQSILPRPEKLNEYVSESFVFYSPLDVVSGDFYWFTQKGDYLLVCCADCTGHGVPGAFMSMIATTLLKDVCNITTDDVSPSYVLSQIDEKIIELLGQNQSETGAAKDGLDIALVSINLRTKHVRMSAARRPIVVIKDQDIITVSGVKRSIGDTEMIFRERPFVDTEIQLHSGDCIYMYSDGYSDQFGGNDGAKLKNVKVKKFLRAIHDDDMDEQSLTMQELFMQWKGDFPQTDDVLFMGLRL